MRNQAAALKRELDRRWFARAVDRVVASLSSELQLSMDNLHIVVEAEPPEALSSGPDDQLFGFYEGVPLTERSGDYGLVLPDRIMIYQGPLERAFPDSADLYEQIRITVLHEIAHHFG
ncbi:MAG: metallopeptidase family protein, partial [Thermomicrobiales bacterium]